MEFSEIKKNRDNKTVSKKEMKRGIGNQELETRLLDGLGILMLR